MKSKLVGNLKRGKRNPIFDLYMLILKKKLLSKGVCFLSNRDDKHFTFFKFYRWGSKSRKIETRVSLTPFDVAMAMHFVVERSSTF